MTSSPIDTPSAAIAAVAPTIRAGDHEVAIALATRERSLQSEILVILVGVSGESP